MTTKAGKNVRAVWLDIPLHDRLRALSKLSKRTIRDTVEMCLEFGIPGIIAEIEKNEILSKLNKERSFDEVSREQTEI